MTVEVFLMLLFAFSVVTSLITEAIKKIISDKENLSYNIIALIVAIFVGGIGTLIFYQLNGYSWDINNIIYLFLLSLASGLVSELGYDKVVQAIKQITDKQINIDKSKDEEV